MREGSEKDVPQCRYCGDSLPETPHETEHGVFCDEYHAQQYETHYTGLFTRFKRRLGLGSGAKRYGDPPGESRD